MVLNIWIPVPLDHIFFALELGEYFFGEYFEILRIGRVFYFLGEYSEFFWGIFLWENTPKIVCLRR